MDNYAAFNLWANRRLVTWLSTKPDHLLHQEYPSSYSSMIKTLDHIWGVEEFWYSIITETTEYENRFGTKHIVNDEVFNGLLRKSEQLANVVKGYSEQDLFKTIVPPEVEQQCPLPRYDFLQHLVNHGTYHRGQLIAIGRGLGVTDAPTTDYNVYHDPV